MLYAGSGRGTENAGGIERGSVGFCRKENVSPFTQPMTAAITVDDVHDKKINTLSKNKARVLEMAKYYGFQKPKSNQRGPVQKRFE